MTYQTYRRQAGNAITRLALNLLMNAHEYGFSHKHIGAAFEEMAVSFVVRHAEEDGKPMHATEIAKVLGIPRSNVVRALASLLEHNVIQAGGNNTYIADPIYFAKPGGEERFERVRAEILKTARVLRPFKKSALKPKK